MRVSRGCRCRTSRGGKGSKSGAMRVGIGGCRTSRGGLGLKRREMRVVGVARVLKRGEMGPGRGGLMGVLRKVCGKH